MSYWTYIDGTITVYPMGRTQPEKRYILDTVLEHLPKVTGSEFDMNIHVIQKSGFNSSCSRNEFSEWFQGKDHETQDYYILVLEASLRDRKFDETLREFNNWLNRLARRAGINDILVRVKGQDRELIISDAKPYQQMGEWPSWFEEKSQGEPMWCEYLMWERDDLSGYPLKYVYKYFNDPDVVAEMERRKKWVEERRGNT